MVGWVIAGVGALVAVVVLWLLFRSNGGVAQDGRARIMADGFYVRGFPSGSRVRWRALVAGKWRSGAADVAGAETFVYTGGTPSEVQLQGAGEAPVSAPVSSGPPSSDDGGGDSSGFTGFPSAY